MIWHSWVPPKAKPKPQPFEFWTVRLNGKYEHHSTPGYWMDSATHAVRYKTRDAAVAAAQAWERKGYKDVCVEKVTGVG